MMSHPSVAIKLETQAIEERIGFHSGVASVGRKATIQDLGKTITRRRERIARSLVTLMTRTTRVSSPVSS